MTTHLQVEHSLWEALEQLVEAAAVMDEVVEGPHPVRAPPHISKRLEALHRALQGFREARRGNQVPR